MMLPHELLWLGAPLAHVAAYRDRQRQALMEQRRTEQRRLLRRMAA